jgi:hypothetical protein
MRLVTLTRARLVRPEIPFPPMVVARPIPGNPALQVGDAYPNPGADKRARLRAALYFDERRIAPAQPLPQQPAAPAAETSKEKKHHGRS